MAEDSSSSMAGPDYDYFNGTMFMEDPFLVWPVFHVMILFYTLAFILGLAGNLLVLFVIIRNKSMQTVTNFFLANLAVADLLVVIFCIIPKLFWYVVPSWPLGVIICKLHFYMISATSCASIFILTVISVERFIAIIFPLRTRQLLTARHLVIVISFVWLSSASFNIQQIIVSTVALYPNNNLYCLAGDMSIKYKEIHTMMSFLVFYLIPLLIMTILYGLICRKLWVNTDNLHAISEKDKKSTGTENKRFWRKFPPKVRYFVNTRGSKCVNGNDDLGKLGKPADKKDAENPDEVQILMENTSGDNSKENNNPKIGPFLLDEAPEETSNTPSSPTHSQAKDENGPEPIGDQIPLKTGPQFNSVSKDELGSSTNTTGRTQNSLPTSYQRSLSRVPQKSHEKKSKKNKREEVLSARKKVIRLLVVIVISFAVCLFPVQLVAMWTTFGYYPMMTFSGQMSMPIAFWLYFFNSAINPFLYAFLSDNFRRKMKVTLLPQSVRRRQEWSRQTQASVRTSEVPTETETMCN